MSQAIHRDSRHDIRGFAPANKQMAHGDLHSLLKQEINERTSIAPDAWHNVQKRVVYGAPDTLRDGSRDTRKKANARDRRG
jgi:hypothetical protein